MKIKIIDPINPKIKRTIGTLIKTPSGLLFRKDVSREMVMVSKKKFSINTYEVKKELSD